MSRGSHEELEHRTGNGVAAMGQALSEEVADAMFALSTPSRVRILSVLMQGPVTVTELTETLGMEQSAVSHQLRILREHQLVRAERDGRRRVYDLHSEHLVALIQAALDHVARLEGRGRRLGRRRLSAASGDT